MRKVVITLPLENIFRLHYNKGGNIVVFEEAICEYGERVTHFCGNFRESKFWWQKNLMSALQDNVCLHVNLLFCVSIFIIIIN